MESDKSEETVAVPRWAIEFILENCSLCDMGVRDEGWSSAKMKQAQETIEQALGAAKA